MKNLRAQVKNLDKFRAQYNPLRSITIQKVVGHLEQGELGNYADLQWLYRMIEKRDPVLRALIRRRAAALLKLDWDIKVVPEDQFPKGATKQMADTQADALREMYDGIDNLKEAIRVLALAEFRGYTHLQKYFNDRASINPEQIDELAFIEQWYWTRDGYKGDWLFDERMTGSWRSGEEVDPRSMVVREVSDPVNEIALIAFLRKNLSQKDWDGFVEVFGIPDIFFVMPQGLATDQQEAWLATAERMAGDGRGALPPGGDVKSVGGDVRGTNPFKEHLSYQDTMVVLAGTGGKLTMLSDPTGIGQGATDAHEDAFNELAQAEAAEISEILQRNLDIPLLKAKFPGQPVLAYFEIAAKDEEDVASLIDNAQKLHQAGIEFDVDDLAERTGYRLSRSAQAAIPVPDIALEDEKTASKNRSFLSRILNRSKKDPAAILKKNARNAIAEAVALDLRPIALRLAEIIDDPDDSTLVERLQYFHTYEFPKLSETALEDPSSAVAFNELLNASFFNGLEGE